MVGQRPTSASKDLYLEELSIMVGYLATPARRASRRGTPTGRGELRLRARHQESGRWLTASATTRACPASTRCGRRLPQEAPRAISSILSGTNSTPRRWCLRLWCCRVAERRPSTRADHRAGYADIDLHYQRIERRPSTRAAGLHHRTISSRRTCRRSTLRRSRRANARAISNRNRPRSPELQRDRDAEARRPAALNASERLALDGHRNPTMPVAAALPPR